MKAGRTRRANKPSPEAPPPVTDPTLAALLNYIAGSQPQYADHCENVAIARKVLYATPDRSQAFDGRLGHPDIHEEIYDSIKADKNEFTAAIVEIVSHPAVRQGSAEEVTCRGLDIRGLADVAIGQAVIIGATVMYDLLKGGVR